MLRFFFKWRVANLLVRFPDIEFCFGTRVRSLPNALRIATPNKRLPGAGGGFLTSLWSELVNAILKKVMAPLEVGPEFAFFRRLGE